MLVRCIFLAIRTQTSRLIFSLLNKRIQTSSCATSSEAKANGSIHHVQSDCRDSEAAE